MIVIADGADEGFFHEVYLLLIFNTHCLQLIVNSKLRIFSNKKSVAMRILLVRLMSIKSGLLLQSNSGTIRTQLFLGCSSLGTLLH